MLKESIFVPKEEKTQRKLGINMTILTDEIKEDLVRPENLEWTLMSAVAGDDLRYGIELLIERLQASQNGEEPLTTEQIIRILANLLREHKEAMDSIY